MNFWTTFRFVRPIAPEAMAWATLSFATYLAASDMHPSFWGHAIDPLALALAVQMVLSFTKNMTDHRFIKAFPKAPVFTCIMLLLTLVCLCIMAVFATDRTAAMIFVCYYLCHAAGLAWTAAYGSDAAPSLQGRWKNASAYLRPAVALEAAGIAVCGATLFFTWTFAGAFAFAAMMSFGMLVMRVMVNWIIVLYMLDAENRGTHGDPHD